MSLKKICQLHSYQWQELLITDVVKDLVEEMDTVQESQEIIYGYPNFEWRPGNSITDCYKNKDDGQYEYEHSEGVQEEMPLVFEVEIHEPLEDEIAIQEMGEEKYPGEDPNIIT